MIGAVVGIVVVGGVLVLAAVVCLLRCICAEWQDDQQEQDAEVARQLAAIRAALRMELAGRHAWQQLRQIDRETASWRS